MVIFCARLGTARATTLTAGDSLPLSIPKDTILINLRVNKVWDEYWR